MDSTTTQTSEVVATPVLEQQEVVSVTEQTAVEEPVHQDKMDVSVDSQVEDTEESKDDLNDSTPTDVQQEEAAPVVKLTADIPKSEDFLASRKQALETLAQEEEVRKGLTPDELAKAQLKMVEDAFKARSPSDPEVRVLIDGDKKTFQKATEQAVLEQGYNIEYVLEKKAPGKTVAYIVPSPKMTSSPFGMLSALMSMGLISPNDVLSMMLGGPMGGPLGGSSLFGGPGLGGLLGDDDDDEGTKPSEEDGTMPPVAAKAPCKFCGKVHN